ncbi:hypothetical protein ACFO1B_40790 [Dactylosporangium siamense]|uniref:2,3-dihydroxyphenylpropionate 1,2-dioxygenase n=1 Tax=Dactylosporangium siamense TaxID=685454 RepID=A0A919U4W6_9ACTN|nr:hypothetical protein [Dactylosporangium siamense]GIG42594.1 2,3-dihydroxyphenylpropionate 1,2-dioxygenase [Dactylosporangium siamense]
MAEIVIGVGASHSTLMNTHWDQAVHPDRATRFRTALADARQAIQDSGADTVVVVGSNHFRGFWLDLIPPFTLGVGEVHASGESGTPAGPQRVDVALARHLAEDLVERQHFDLAYSARLQIDHGQSHAIQYLTGDLPIVPLVVNMFAPPLPTLARCAALGTAVAEAVATFPVDRRVAVVGSGGLSHRLPWPDWRDPHGEDERFMVEAWLDGRGDWQRFDPRRRQIIRAAQPCITPTFDHDLLRRVRAGELATLAELSTADLELLAGNGGQEIRSWLIMAAALRFVPGTVLAYEEMPEWLTGMAVATIIAPEDSP